MRSVTERIAPGEIHLWCLPLDVHEEVEEALLELLSADELYRAEHFRFEQHRRRFIARRGGLRRLIARYVDEDPGRLVFAYGAAGKPSLRLPSGEPLAFSVASSHGLGLVAITRDEPVGVDLERIRDDVRWRALAGAFGETERAALASLPDDVGLSLFFRLWTRKEAYSKALGAGLRLPLDATNMIRPLAGWVLADVDVANGFAAAVACPGQCSSAVLGRPILRPSSARHQAFFRAAGAVFPTSHEDSPPSQWVARYTLG